MHESTKVRNIIKSKVGEILKQKTKKQTTKF